MKLCTFLSFTFWCFCLLKVSLSHAEGVSLKEETDREASENFRQDLQKSLSLQENEEPQDSEATSNRQKRKEGNKYDTIAKLNSAVEKLQRKNDEKDVQIASMIKQIDALIRQDAKTLQLLGAVSRKSSSAGVRIGTLSSRAGTTSVITTGGTHYIRWGSSDCPNTAFPVYRGYMAGSHYANNNGGSTMLCLHNRPEWGSRSVSSSNYIYGTEYAFSSYPFSSANYPSGLAGQDVPCIVCHAPTRSNKMMIPGRLSCPVGWTREYKGYIVSNYYSYARAEYICVDETPDVRIGGSGYSSGARLYPAIVACSSLPCPRYISGAPVTCVVCTK